MPAPAAASGRPRQTGRLSAPGSGLLVPQGQQRQEPGDDLLGQPLVVGGRTSQGDSASAAPSGTQPGQPVGRRGQGCWPRLDRYSTAMLVQQFLGPWSTSISGSFEGVRQIGAGFDLRELPAVAWRAVGRRILVSELADQQCEHVSRLLLCSPSVWRTKAISEAPSPYTPGVLDRHFVGGSGSRGRRPSMPRSAQHCARANRPRERIEISFPRHHE